MRMVCKTCRGAGYVEGWECPSCKGTGYVEVTLDKALYWESKLNPFKDFSVTVKDYSDHPYYPKTYKARLRTCPYCGGHGLISGYQCPNCGGSGRIIE